MASRGVQQNGLQRVATRRRGLPDLSLVSGDLVAISSLFDQLRDEFLKLDERAKFGLVLRRKYRELVYIAARSRDDETRARLRRLLASLGGVRVRLVGQEEEGSQTASVRLRDAIRTGKVVEWISHFYCGVHGIKEAQTSGFWEAVEVDESSYSRFLEELTSLLHWLQSRIER